jgi:hypothetical protein
MLRQVKTVRSSLRPKGEIVTSNSIVGGAAKCDSLSLDDFLEY